MGLYADRVEEARQMEDEQLLEAAQGCTELTCMYHGPINTVVMERKLGRWSK
jgi:hypothetical protein